LFVAGGKELALHLLICIKENTYETDALAEIWLGTSGMITEVKPGLKMR